MHTSWTITAADIGIRLDVFLTHMLPEQTRSQMAKQIKAGGVMVNDKPATVHRFLKIGDVVRLTPLRSPITRAKASPLPAVVIIAETADWMVIHKPSGLLVHPASDTRRDTDPAPTLIDFLLAHVPGIATVGDDPARPGIVHRLDKDVSGLMVIAKTRETFEDLKRQFAEHMVDKRYLALVDGKMEKNEGDITFNIARSKTKQRMAARPEHEEGKVARTHYRVLRRLRNATLIELTIHTGRTHQIRAHLFALNHPIIGDTLYRRKSNTRHGKRMRDPVSGTRLLLQAVHLSFQDPRTGEKREFALPPIPEFDTLIRNASPDASA